MEKITVFTKNNMQEKKVTGTFVEFDDMGFGITILENGQFYVTDTKQKPISSVKYDYILQESGIEFGWAFVAGNNVHLFDFTEIFCSEDDFVDLVMDDTVDLTIGFPRHEDLPAIKKAFISGASFCVPSTEDFFDEVTELEYKVKWLDYAKQVREKALSLDKPQYIALTHDSRVIEELEMEPLFQRVDRW